MGKSTKIFTALVVVAMLFGVAVFASRTDNRIESAAKNSYVFKTYLNGDSITTESKKGVVTLKGSVSDESHRMLAQDTVEGIPGVKEVDNQLVVKGEHFPENSDAWIMMKVKTALLFHRNVSVLKTEVDVKNGVVLLTGEVSSLAQKELNTEYASDITGVKSVKNEMVITNEKTETGSTVGEKIDDMSITAQVKMALLTHRSTSAIKTNVTTKNGVVMLSGVAKNTAEIALVGKLAKDIKGVISVVNDMTVAN